MMPTDINSPLTKSDLAALLQGSDAVAVAIRLVGNNVIHAGQISDPALGELDRLLITSWNHLDRIEPPYHMISELGGKPMVIHSSFVNERSLAFLAFPSSTPNETVDAHTEAIVNKLRTFNLKIVQQEEKKEPSISEWLLEGDNTSMETDENGSLIETKTPTTFGSSPEPVISQKDVVNNTDAQKDSDLGDIPLADVIGLMSKDDPIKKPTGTLPLDSTDNTEWQILQTLNQEETESKPAENHSVLGIINATTEGQINVSQSGWVKQVNGDQTLEPEIEKTDSEVRNIEPGQIDSTFFYLVPRVTYHYLIGDLSQRLREWVPEICNIYNWKLGLLSVRPDYLRWSLEGFPEYSIPGMLKILREETSNHIFTEFPGLKQENNSGDYWSSSYLIDRDDQHFSTQALILMISKDRLSK